MENLITTPVLSYESDFLPNIITAERIANALGGRWIGDGWLAHCPAHNDKNPSLSINENNQGKILVYCHAGCRQEDVIAALKARGLWNRGNGCPDLPPGIKLYLKDKRYISHWAYKNTSGEVIGYAVRYENYSNEKVVLPYFKKKGDHWRLGAHGTPRPLFNLDKIYEATGDIWIVEGEKCVEAAEGLGLIATTSLSGSNGARKTDWSPLAGRDVIIWPDNDNAGEKYKTDVINELNHMVPLPSIKVVDISSLGLPEGGDIVDWIKTGKTKEDIKALEINSISNLKVIEIEPGKLPDVVDASENYLISSTRIEIFQRANQLVRIAKEQKGEKGIVRDPTSVVIYPIDTPYLIEAFSKSAMYMKYDMRKRDYKIVDIPENVARIYMSRVGHWRVPYLAGIIKAPTLRNDGSILDKPGYDEETGLFYYSGNVHYEIKPNPSKEEALISLENLKLILKDFPFCEKADMSVALAAILTSLIRVSIRSAPLFAFTAPVMGSGKSLLTDIVSMIATGRRASALPQSKNSDEDRKRILSLLLSGDPIICFDNIERPLEGDALCSVLTQETFQDRILGSNKIATVSTKTTILANGNNLVFSGDLTSRVLLCRIDPGLEKPEERKFATDLYVYIPKHRKSIVEEALMILRAYIVAGKPEQDIRPFG